MADVAWTDEMWCVLATLLGFNELAKTQDTLGRKLFCRLMVSAAEKRLRDLGVNIDVKRSPRVITLPRVPEVSFTAADIELMRACVAKHDRESAELVRETTEALDGIRYKGTV